MKDPNIIEKFRIWQNAYHRIRFFKKMYPLSAIAKDIFLFPYDYALNRRSIQKVRNVTFAITHKCNIRCEMCYFHKELKNIWVMPLYLYKQAIDSVKGSHPCIILSGGEPFTHPNLVDMVAYAKKMHLPVQIFTNGTLVKPEIADALVKLKLDYIDFTLLGNEKSHSLVAHVPNAYNRFVENLQYFAKHRGNTQIILNYTITPRSLKDIDHAVELVKRFKLDGLRIQHYNFLLKNEFEAQECLVKGLFGSESNTHEIENQDDVSNMAKQILEIKKQLPEKLTSVPIQWAPTLTALETENWYSTKRFMSQRKCLFPWRGITIDANGKVYPCSKIYLELGNIENQNIFDVWNSERMQKFRLRLKKERFPACSRCCKL